MGGGYLKAHVIRKIVLSVIFIKELILGHIFYIEENSKKFFLRWPSVLQI